MENDAMVRTLLGAFSGTAVAALAMTGCWYGIARLHPLPTSAQWADPDSLLDYAAATPLSAQACVLASWALAGLLGGWVAARIARDQRGPAALVVGTLVTIAVIAYATLIPNPEWMTVVGVLLPVPFSALAALAAMPRHGT